MWLCCLAITVVMLLSYYCSYVAELLLCGYVAELLLCGYVAELLLWLCC